MATGKVKKMAFGGMGKQPANALRPMQNAAKQDMNSKAAQFQRAGTTFGKPGGSQTAKTGLGQAMNKPTMGLGAAMANKKLAGVGALAGRALGAQAAQQQAMKGGAKFAPDSGYVQQLKQMTPDQRQRTMAINAAKNAAETQRVNQFNAMTPEQRIRAEGMKKGLASLGKKKGGAVKKATKK